MNTLIKPPCTNGTEQDKQLDLSLIAQLKQTEQALADIRTHFPLGYVTYDNCFEYTLIELEGIIGWQLSALPSCTKFKNESTYLGYPVISCNGTFESYREAEIDISGMNTENVLSMSHMFHFCKANSLDLCKLNTQHCAYADYLVAESNISFIKLRRNTFMLKNVDNTGMFSLFAKNRPIVVALVDNQDTFIDAAFFTTATNRERLMDELEEHMIVDSTLSPLGEYCMDHLGLNVNTTYEYVGHNKEKDYEVILKTASLADAVLIKVII